MIKNRPSEVIPQTERKPSVMEKKTNPQISVFQQKSKVSKMKRSFQSRKKQAFVGERSRVAIIHKPGQELDLKKKSPSSEEE